MKRLLCWLFGHKSNGVIVQEKGVIRFVVCHCPRCGAELLNFNIINN